MELSIQERLKDLRVERGLTLEQLAEQTHLSKSALGSYEAEDNPLEDFLQTAEKPPERTATRSKRLWRLSVNGLN